MQHLVKKHVAKLRNCRYFLQIAFANTCKLLFLKGWNRNCYSVHIRVFTKTFVTTKDSVSAHNAALDVARAAGKPATRVLKS